MDLTCPTRHLGRPCDAKIGRPLTGGVWKAFICQVVKSDPLWHPTCSKLGLALSDMTVEDVACLTF